MYIQLSFSDYSQLNKIRKERKQYIVNVACKSQNLNNKKTYGAKKEVGFCSKKKKDLSNHLEFLM